jgi:hypothetical protein
MVPTVWNWIRNNRRYGRRVRKYTMDMREMCQCHGAFFLMWVGHFVGTGDNYENTS